MTVSRGVECVLVLGVAVVGLAIDVIELAHNRNAGRVVARTNAFQVVFRVTMMMMILILS